MQVYINEELEKYKKDVLSISPEWKKRDFTQKVTDYIGSSTEKIFAVSGLRGTGKTVGILQAADNSNHDIAYVLTQRDEKETAEDYVRFLKSTDKKVVIFDEYSWIKDRDILDKYLLTSVQDGKRIILTATESITLDFMNYGRQMHRVQPVHTTMFTYDEYLRLSGRKPCKEACTDFLEKGGLFEDYILQGFDSAKAYIEDAIVSNLAGYMQGEMDEEKARTLTYAVLYKAICPSNLSSIPTLRENHVTLENYLEQMGVNTDYIPQDGEIERIADVFEQTGIIVRIPNFNEDSDLREQYYITNPSLTCQLIKGVYGLASLDNSILGHVFEAAAAVQLYTNKLTEHKIWFYNNGSVKENPDNKELDIVVTDQDRESAYLFECKFKKKDSLNQDVTLLSGYLEEHEFKDIDILGRYVIYNGTPSVREYDVGTVIFSPMGDMLNNYFEFEENVRKIELLSKGHDYDNDKDGKPKASSRTVSRSVEDLVNSFADKAKKVKTDVSQMIAEEKERVLRSFAIASERTKQHNKVKERNSIIR